MGNSRLTVAAHILAFLAMGFDLPMTSENLAMSVNTNPVVIRRILSSLRKAGLVASQPGVGGGMRLTRAPEAITLCDVYDTLGEGELFPLHPNDPHPMCPCGSTIQSTLTPVYTAAENALRDVLSTTSIADVAAENWATYHARHAQEN